MDSLWSDRYVQLTSYTQSELNECTLALAEIQAQTYRQDKTTCSLLRRYLKTTKDNELYVERIRDIIHSSKGDDDDDDEEDDVLDLTLDEFDENQMSMDHQRWEVLGLARSIEMPVGSLACLPVCLFIRST